MAKSKKPTTKQVSAIAKAALATMDAVIDCQTLFAAAEAIQQLIAENCPIAKPNTLESKR